MCTLSQVLHCPKKLCSFAKHSSSLNKLCALSQNYYIAPISISFTKHLHSLTKVFNCPENLCVPSQNICILSQKYCVAPRNSAFSHKTFVLPRETLYPLAKVLHCPKQTLRSLAKHSPINLAFSQKSIASRSCTFLHITFAFSNKSIELPQETQHSFSKHLCSLTKVLHWPKKLYFHLQNICVLLQKFFFIKWKWSDVWPSMVTHTCNLCSAFNPHTHTLSSEHTPGAVGSHIAAAPGEQLGVWCLAQGSHLNHGIEGGRGCWLFTPPTYNPCRTWDSNLQPLCYKSDSLGLDCPLTITTHHSVGYCRPQQECEFMRSQGVIGQTGSKLAVNIPASSAEGWAWKGFPMEI